MSVSTNSILQEFAALVDKGELRKPKIHGRDCRVLAKLLGAFILRGRRVELPPEEMLQLQKDLIRILGPEAIKAIEAMAKQF